MKKNTNFSKKTTTQVSPFLRIIRSYALAIFFVFATTVANAQFAGGTGSSTNPYLITTPAQLNAVRNNLNASYKLVNDIDLADYLSPGGAGYNSGDGWLPIGYIGTPFRGSFDGNNKVIKNLSINRPNGEIGLYIGLFGFTDGAMMDNLGIENCTIVGRYFVGGLAGEINRTSITNCYAMGSITAASATGGLVGYNYNGSSITRSYAAGSVGGVTFPWANIGGLVGQNDGGSSITYCYASSSISATYQTAHAGGLVGGNTNNSRISNCYAVGDLYVTNSSGDVGSLLGYNDNSFITNCYATGRIRGFSGSDIGGLVGYSYNSALTNCFFDITTTGQTIGVGNNHTDPGAIGLSTAQMQALSPPSIYANGGWDFTNDWIMLCAGKSYPLLRWQVAASGSGSSPSDPYMIATAQQLDNIRRFTECGVSSGKYWRLAHDIDLTTYIAWHYPTNGWLPIGEDYFSPFSGNFNGARHKITGLWINRSGNYYSGLFSSLYDAHIDSLGVEIANAGVIGYSYVGGITGGNQYSTISACYSSGNVSGTNYVGGLAGGNYNNATISNSYATGCVTATGNTANIGGLAGWNYQSNISNSYAANNITATGSAAKIGGLVGSSENSSTIENCVAANDSLIATQNTATINRIAGANSSGIYHNNYANSGITVRVTGSPIAKTDDATVNGTGKTLAELKTFAFYNTTTNWFTTPPASTWNIANTNDPTKIWKIYNTYTFPLFQWQQVVNTITATAGANGNITPGGNVIVTVGEDTTFRFIPNGYYLVDSVFVNGVYNAAAVAAGSYTFHTVTGDSSIRVTFKSPFCGGDGTTGNPFLICTAGQLDSVRYFLSSNFKLNQDIDLTDYIAAKYSTNGWVPFGTFGRYFKGSGHKITGLWINRILDDIGLFTTIDGGRIDSLGVEIAPAGIIRNIINSSYYNYTGGLASYVKNNSTIDACYVTGNVTGEQCVGGLVGDVWNSTVRNSYFTGSVTGTGNEAYIGGLVGRSANFYSSSGYSTTISNSYATGSVKATGSNANIGGLVGTNDYDATIKNCVAANDSLIATQSTTTINRIAGANSGGAFQNNYANSGMIVVVTGSPTAITDDADINGAGKTLTELKTFDFYNTTSNWSAPEWSIANTYDDSKIWKICQGDYPMLTWEPRASAICSFMITATAGANGTIAPAGDTLVAAGTDATFTFTPDPSYEIDKVLIDGIPLAIVGNSYTFINVHQDYTIEVTFKSKPTIPTTKLCPLTVTDAVGNTYKVSNLSGLCWTENLRTTVYPATGVTIPFAKAYTCPICPAELDSVFGLLYHFESAIDEICPDGWHIPSQTEWELLNYYSTKELMSVQHWIGNIAPGTDVYGFGAPPAGFYNNILNRYEKLYGFAGWWSSESISTTTAACFCINYFCSIITNEMVDKNFGLSLRCIASPSLPVVNITSSLTTICIDGALTMTATPTGGSWASGTTETATIDEDSGELTPVAAGTTLITYTYTDGNGCTNTDTKTITVENCIPCGTVAGPGGTTLTFMCYNLGAAPAVQTLTPEQQQAYTTQGDVYGDLYQWGRLADGHQLRTSGTTTTLSATDIPGHADFITNLVYPYDWRSPQNNTLWNIGTETAPLKAPNDPCPAGWRIPTQTELSHLVNSTLNERSWQGNGYLVRPVGSSEYTLFFPATGYRYRSDGTLYGAGSDGYYWNSTASGSGVAYYLYLGSGNAYMDNYYRSYGYSVRCVSE